MRILLNHFKSYLCILSFIAFLLLFTPVLTANEPATKPTNQEFKQKTAKLHMPFIANNGQVDEQVKFYAKTFGGTVFVTKEGEIVYALPGSRPEDASSQLIVGSSECRGEWHSPSGISPLKRGEKGVCNKTPNPNDRNETHPQPLLLEGRSGVAPKEDVSPRPLRERDRVRGVSLKEELVGARIKAIHGEEPSVTKVSYFKGNDPSKWKTNISTYDSVNLGEIYDGIELKLRAYGNNVEKLFCIKPGADPEQIKIRLSGVKGCGVQNAEITHPLVPSRDVINPKSDASTSLSMTSFLAESRNQNPKLQINKSGELEVETELGSVKFTKPVAYQEIEGKRVEVECKYTIADCGMQNAEYKTNPKSKIRNLSSTSIGGPKSRNSDTKNPKSAIQNQKLEYGFKVASYDKSKDLIIDPLLASTYLGGSDDDYSRSLALDTSGNVYVTGETGSTDFPTTSGAYDTSYNDSGDVFVSKLDGRLSSLLASTYLGGSIHDYVYSLALDTSGDVYVTGYTQSTNFPITDNAYDTSFNVQEYNNGDLFISKLNNDLTQLLASTYLGGSGDDWGRSLALGTSGNVYVTGITDSSDFPTTSGAYDTSYNGGGDIFVSKLDSGLMNLLSSTFIGEGSVQFIVIDKEGNIYITGYTGSWDFPTTSGAYDTSYNIDGDGGDVFVSKLDGGLSSLLASTYLGGSGRDEVYSLILDTIADVYVTGNTQSTDFPTTSGAYDASYNGGDYHGDVFVSKLNGGLTSLLASTFLGGDGNDYGNSLAIDTSGDVYVAGTTRYSSDFPTTLGAYDTSFNGYWDVFVSKLNNGLSSLLASTYLGGSDYDEGYSLALDTSGDVYVTGYTSSKDFPGSTDFLTTSGAYDTSYNGSEDVFVSKLDSDLSASITPIPTPTATPTVTQTTTPTETPTPTATPTPTPIICNEATDIDAEPDLLILRVKMRNTVIVTVTGEDNCPVEGDTVGTKVYYPEIVRVSPRRQVTDENGEAVFTIKARGKTGDAVVIFRDGSLITQVSVKVVK